MRTREACEAAQVLELMLPGTPVTVSQIAQKLCLTEKQARTRLQLTEDLLMENDWGQIARKPRVGSWI
ncbi:hypothetical protein [Faecalibaculum rodentium]|nr:hypothetical protein [Faecalibaculum rodentium]